MTAAAFAPKPRPPVVDGIDFNKPITDSPALTSYVLMECGEGFSVEDWKADNTVCCANCDDRYLYNWDFEAIERGDDGVFRCDDCAVYAPRPSRRQRDPDGGEARADR